MKTITYSIKMRFKTGITKTWSLYTAYSTFRRWNENIEKFMPDNYDLDDAKKLLNIALKFFPDYKFKIIETTMITKEI